MWWLPYVKYTYAVPGGPYITALRAVIPLVAAWLPESSLPRYASVSTMTPAVTAPSTFVTTTQPISSGATNSGERVKNSEERGVKP